MKELNLSKRITFLNKKDLEGITSLNLFSSKVSNLSVLKNNKILRFITFDLNNFDLQHIREVFHTIENLKFISYESYDNNFDYIGRNEFNRILKQKIVNQYFKKMTSDDIRQEFNSKLTYSDIGRTEIESLISILKDELKCFKEFPMRVCFLRKNDIAYDMNEHIKYCYIMVNGDYFKRREAISFNKDGFIGIAGWASSPNEKPILNSLKKWLDNF